jgi:XTP/dITP diphosphohydrolase
MPRLLLATNNPGKIAELNILFEGCGWKLVTPGDLGLDFDVPEDGETYADNARVKALAGMEASGLVTLADDSGLEITALEGEPGVHSARFLGEDATYAERFAEIARRLAAAPRNCRFVCVMAIADPLTGNVQFARGEVNGLVADKPRGASGFGYDPIFWVPQHTATMAELPDHQKNIISHRAIAAAGARQVLRELLHAHTETDPSYARH